jgi:hypothetical protein
MVNEYRDLVEIYESVDWGNKMLLQYDMPRSRFKKAVGQYRGGTDLNTSDSGEVHFRT